MHVLLEYPLSIKAAYLVQVCSILRRKLWLHDFDSVPEAAEPGIKLVRYGKNNQDLRLYSSGLSLEEAKEIVAYASPLLDTDLSKNDIDNVLERIDKNGEANGEFLGKLGILLLGKYKSEGYELMIKKE